MDNNENFEYFTEQLLENAIKEFRATGQYKSLQEQLNRMDADCETILNPTERGFVTECFELLLDVKGKQEQYVYRQGMLDSVKILKWMGVLA